LIRQSERQHASRLPVPLSSLVAREQELETVQKLVLDPQVRLVTLTGAPGVGKTRLALAAAHRMCTMFPDGVWFVPLAGVQRRRLLLSTIAHALGIRQFGRPSPLDSVTRALADQRVLLVLDNLEHLLAATPSIAQLLSACSGLTVLATSRAPLRVSGEYLVHVAPLALPTLCPLQAHEDLARVPSVRLLVERAAAAAPGFRMTPSNARALAELCVRLDGLPLAIELAAARCRLLDPTELLARLTHPDAVLSNGPRDAPSRHRTLRAAISWSHELLTSDQQRLFRRLAVFAGGCTLEAAQAVAWAADEPSHDVFDAATSLIDHSLLRTEPDPDGVLRFGMLETIREFALERLAASGEQDATRDRHARYFASLSERASSPRLDGAQGPALLARLEREHDNVRAALRWLLDYDDHGRGVQVAGALWSFWEQHDHASEGLMWLEEALARCTAVRPADRARALLGVAVLRREKAEYEAAEAPARECVAILRTLHDDRALSESLIVLSNIVVLTGCSTEAAALAAEGLAIRRRLHDDVGSAWAMVVLGHVLMVQGDFVAARNQCEAALALRQGRRDNLVDGWILRCLGAIHAGGGNLALARSLLECALDVFRRHGCSAGVGSSLLGLGDLALQVGDQRVGDANLREAEAHLARAGQMGWHAAALLRQGRPPATHLVSAFGPTLRVAVWRMALGRDIPAAFDSNAALIQRHVPALPAGPRTAAPDALTRRERQVLALLGRRYSNWEIADELVLSRRTVERHMANIFSKFGVSSRREARAYAREHGLLLAEDRSLLV
jgi:predicted ATPase/DNA-binding CsgD family transcriptional regulator